MNNVLDYETRIISHIHEDGRWEAISADGAVMQFMPRPIAPVEITKSAMRMGQALLVHEKWSTNEPVEIHTSKPAWWDTVERFLYGDRCESTCITQAVTCLEEANRMVISRRHFLRARHCYLKNCRHGWNLAASQIVGGRSHHSMLQAQLHVLSPGFWMQLEGDYCIG